MATHCNMNFHFSDDLCELFLQYDFQVTGEEISSIMKDFDEPGYLAPTGLHLGGAKYMVIQGEAGAVLRGKKVRVC